jgi:hypothetical protein
MKKAANPKTAVFVTRPNVWLAAAHVLLAP